MTLPKNRTRKYNVKVRKTNKGSKKVYSRPKKKGGVCALCSTKLAGISISGSKTEKSVSRIFGGSLCHSCTEQIIKESVRVSEKEKSIDAVDLSIKKYVQQLVKE
ncbi:hypothetical protein KJ780_00770 [Candidatus Micrarchaeota archaeon]|nr:hypothetical protein [Candidatus Micrarchaeota archaeon]